jgi:hypothetical protein
MTGPYVEVLVYAFVTLSDRHDFSRAAAWQGDLGAFDCHLHDGELEAHPRNNYPDSELLLSLIRSSKTT